tara:strand:+ start:2186 stop:2584 length:399 start_codon:yes stop_codon:yes gene_type:complete
MLSKGELRGILLSLPTAEINVSKDKNTTVGYRVRLRVTIRGNLNFLFAIRRSLLQHEIESKINPMESKNRPRPVLYITGISNLENLYEKFILHSKYSNVNWNTFAQVMWMVRQDKHLTQKGLDSILSIKDLI